MTGLIFAALLVLGGIARHALRRTPEAQLPALVITLTRAVVVLVLTYAALRMAGPENVPAVLRAAMRYMKA
ncbi:hypothetical protein [Streptomyces sp. NPDC005345]|uniref:hypothetical protein n=1 Tax=Streptomyces sp. NPDC005345 TaxID=3156877 RepID=UPI0033B2213C